MTISISESVYDRRRSICTDRRRSVTSNYKCFQNYYNAWKYLQPKPTYISNVRSLVNHWQLRDLLQVDAYTGNIYHTLDDSIRALNVFPLYEETLKSHDYLTLPYFPRCFNHSPGGHIVTGGVVTSLSKVFSMNIPDLTKTIPGLSHRLPKGLFSFYSPYTDGDLTFKLGEMINNAVTVYSDQPGSDSLFTSYVCNNDSNLYILDIANSRITADRKIVCENNTSLNNVHQLPDGRLLTATGDSSSIFLLDPKMAQPKIEVIKTSYDSGFGISYHNNENTLAVAFQEGACLLYDLRKPTQQPLFEVKSTRPGHQSGAFRCCKFLHTAIQDLLVISEHVGRVHLVDLGELQQDNQQVLVFPFALDQYGRHKHERLSLREKLMNSQRKHSFGAEEESAETNVDKHKRFEIFDESQAHFSAPLVYDYQYLAEENPKLFKDYVYQPQEMPTCKENDDAVDRPELNHPQWYSTPGSVNQECYSANQAEPETHQHTLVDPHDVRQRLDLEAGQSLAQSADSSDHPPPQQRYSCHDSYQQSVNHIHGEMELSGLDWLENQLYIGCEDGGIITWDINVRARRSIGSFSYV